MLMEKLQGQVTYETNVFAITYIKNQRTVIKFKTKDSWLDLSRPHTTYSQKEPRYDQRNDSDQFQKVWI